MLRDIAWGRKLQGAGPYAATIKKLEGDIVDEMKKVNELIGVCGAYPTFPEHFELSFGPEG
jgi:hypothetical protein